MAMASLEQALSRLIEDLSGTLGLSRDDLAHVIRAHPRSVERWHAGEAFPQREARERLDALEQLISRLRGTFASDDAARAWLQESNRYLGGLTPADALRAGRLDRVEAALEALNSGVFV
jgi:ribosome-binding protein aMBF1 (putative translation factor)